MDVTLELRNTPTEDLQKKQGYIQALIDVADTTWEDM